MLLKSKIMLFLQLSFCGLVEPEAAAIEIIDLNTWHYHTIPVDNAKRTCEKKQQSYHS